MSGSVDLGGRRIIKKIFFKQKTAYEIVTGDWSSDVCSSDLGAATMDCMEQEQERGITITSAATKTTWNWKDQIGRASCRERV